MRTFHLLLLLVLFSFKSQAQSAFTIGPMLHLNISDKKYQVSYGLEAAYWNLSKFPVGVDLGFDFQKGVKRYYAEMQVGLGVVGAGAGPVLEQAKGEPIYLGFQSNFWANYFVGFNLRRRTVHHQRTLAPGLYAKLPFMQNIEDDGDTDWSDVFDD
ncbi:hypothetical protein [Adhaeribacter pallidiroseus]|nr:hypothetical protein [Adhaeribacter pallidiroseus]